MTADYTTSNAAERRERRRQRILENAEKRLISILSGPDGTENRQAPVFDGFVEGTADNNKINTISSPLPSSDTIDFIKPQYLKQINGNRFYICLMFGVIFRLFVLFELTVSIVPIFTAIFLAYTLLNHFSGQDYPKHGYIVNVLLVSGLNEQIVVRIGCLIDTIWEFCVDLLILMFSYSSMSLIFKFAKI